DAADIFAQLEQIANSGDKVRRIERARLQRSFQTKFDIELQPADFTEIVFARIEEHSVEKRGSRLERWRIAGAQLAVNLDQRLARGADGVFVERARNDHTGIVSIGEEDIDGSDARLRQCSPDLRSKGLIGFEQNFARLAIDQIGNGVSAFQVGE